MTGPGVRDLTSFLLGDWRLDREILDGSGAGLVGTFRGTARFALEDRGSDRLRYEEHGTLRLGSYRGPAFRRLTFQVDGARARVAFDDGRHFHDLDLRSGEWEVTHPCGDDRYLGRFEVDSAHRWRQQWTVSGPRKQQLIRTVLERPAETPPVDHLTDLNSPLEGRLAGYRELDATHRAQGR